MQTLQVEDRNALLDKLSKIRALAENAKGEPEGRTALLMYQNLLEKHDIRESEVGLGSAEDAPEEVTAAKGKRIEDWKRRMGHVCGAHMRCFVFSKRRRSTQESSIIFCGLGKDPITAKEMFISACMVAERLCKHYLQSRSVWDRQHLETFKRNYFEGFISGLDIALYAQENSGVLGLIVTIPEILKKRGEEMKTKTYSRFNYDPLSHRHGKKDGENFINGKHITEAQA